MNREPTDRGSETPTVPSTSRTLASMSNDRSPAERATASRRPRPIDIRELQRRDTGSAAPQAITEQPDMLFEREPVAKWIDTLCGLRMTTMLIATRQRIARGEYVPPMPWLGIAIFCGIASAAVVVIAMVAKLITG